MINYCALRHTAGVIRIACHAGTGAGAVVDIAPNIGIAAHPGREAAGLAFVLGFVLDVADGECVGGEAVLVGLYGGCCGGDHRTLQIGIAIDGDLEASIAGEDTGLFVDAGVITLDLAVGGADRAAVVSAAEDRHADAEASTALFVVVGTGVLQTLDGEVAYRTAVASLLAYISEGCHCALAGGANIGDDLIGFDLSTDQIEVTTGFQGQLAACLLAALFCTRFKLPAK